MKRGIWLASAVVSLAALGCTDEPTGPRQKLTLTAAQAAAIVSQAHVIAGARPDLAWLDDSIVVVLKEGAEARAVIVTVDGVEQTYYAVGLIRQFGGTNPFSTFHLIGFDNPDNPSSFAVANGYAAGADSTPPSSATGTFGDGNVFAHLVHVSGTEVKDVQAVQGEAAFVLGDLGATCPGGIQMTCNDAPLVADFNVQIARPDDNPTDTHSVMHVHVVAPGVVLRYN